MYILLFITVIFCRGTDLAWLTIQTISWNLYWVVSNWFPWQLGCNRISEIFKRATSVAVSYKFYICELIDFVAIEYPQDFGLLDVGATMLVWINVMGKLYIKTE